MEYKKSKPKPNLKCSKFCAYFECHDLCPCDDDNSAGDDYVGNLFADYMQRDDAKRSLFHLD